MSEDKIYCSSSFLSYRTIIDESKTFTNKYPLHKNKPPQDLIKVASSQDLYNALKSQIEKVCSQKKVALCLSGGIDSAILAKMLPKGTQTYTFKCVVPGVDVTDETIRAKKYADECGLKHKVVEVYWQDFENFSPILMKHKGSPIHSIEVQMYKAALEAKKDGIELLIYGESADLKYGGLSGLLSKDWTFGEFVDRYLYVKPYQVLKEWNMDLTPIKQFEKDGYIDVHGFNNNPFLHEALNSYYNACETANIEYLLPYSNTILNCELDLIRIRNGENKYVIRELFKMLYKDFEVPKKIPMPRPMNEWFKDWSGPTRPEFWPHCTDNMTGDQKWLVWVLEKYLNMIDEK